VAAGLTVTTLGLWWLQRRRAARRPSPAAATPSCAGGCGCDPAGCALPR
jgi:hypothetical protein